MSGASSLIKDPLTIDFRGRLVAPLKFFLQRNYVPAGLVHTISPDITAAISPAYAEWGLRLNIDDVSAVLYQLPRDDQTDLLVACIGEAAGPMFGLLSGPDYGDQLTQLMALRWPDLYAMFADSQADTPRARKVCRIITNDKQQWVVADELRGENRASISVEQANALIVAAATTVGRMTDPLSLEGIFEILGGPNRRTRRLTAIGGLLEGSASLMQVFAGGLQARELLELKKLVEDCFSHLQELKK